MYIQERATASYMPQGDGYNIYTVL